MRIFWLFMKIPKERMAGARQGPCYFTSRFCLLDDFCDDARAHGAATFANRKAQTFFHGDRGDQTHRHRHVIARQNHLLVLGQLDRASDVRGTEVKLGTVALEERSEERRVGKASST